jgi:hypothetical protein
MFKFIRNADVPDFNGSCTFPVGGKTCVIKCKFRHMGQTEFGAWGGRECGLFDPAQKMAEHVFEAVSDWSDIADESDNPMPFSIATVRDLVEVYPAAYVGFVNGYIAARKTALTGN